MQAFLWNISLCSSLPIEVERFSNHIHDSEDDISLVADCLEGNWGNHDNHEVKDPVSAENGLAASFPKGS